MTKVALVTGAGQKLGAEIARHLGANGFDVIVHVNRSRIEGRAVVHAIETSGGRAELFVGDLTVEDTMIELMARIGAIEGHLDILVNNASIFEYDFPGHGDVSKLTRSLDIHARVPFDLLERLAKKTSRSKPLDVFNILDQKLIYLNPDYLSYTMGKAALKTLTDVWQKSETENIRLFGILPGNMYPSGPQTSDSFEASSKANLLGRAPRPQDVCEAILFFHSNPRLPGQNLAIDAGEHLAARERDPAFAK